ncbi:MAG: hypothetical protein FJ147_28285 [Deltaproteobacteria bacterium]|nr:hypothetical protein [Deltaproteobacteria bacterium]
MKPLGIVDPERLVLIPSDLWWAHEFCFHLHDQIAELLIQYEASGAHRWVTEAFEKALAENRATNIDIDLLKFMKEHDLVRFYQHHIVSHLVLGLTSDMLHFIYEALTCFEKRKFAVGFALLRKPFKENLLFLSWLLADQDDFITRFEKNNYTTLNGVQPARRLEIFHGAIARLITKEVFTPELLEDMIFSKSHARSFEPIWQRASHLITSQGLLLRTEDLNINFIFHDAASDDLFEHIYSNLPYLLLYAVQVALECFARILQSNEHTVSHLIISSLGCFECLFKIEPKQGITAMLARKLRTFLKCIHCDASLRLTRANGIEMYLKETLHCHKCGLSSPFPLYWLLAQTKVVITREDGTVPILQDL